jgi:serine O-acetyltransferase
MLKAVRRTLGKIREDAGRYFVLESRAPTPGPREKLKILLTSPSFFAVAAHRISHLIRIELDPAPRRALGLLSAAIEHASSLLCGVHIDPGAEIGPGLYLGHPGGVWIGPVRMGRDCNITHNTSIGRRSDGEQGVPTFGDRVWIGTGSVVFGPVKVGDGVTIGPLTVVAHDVPPRCLVLGNPMRTIFRDYDNTVQMGTAPVAVRARPADPGPPFNSTQAS